MKLLFGRWGKAGFLKNNEHPLPQVSYPERCCKPHSRVPLCSYADIKKYQVTNPNLSQTVMTDSEKKKSILTRTIKWPWPLNKLFGLLFSKKMVRLYLFSAACLITLMIAFYTVENDRATMAWSEHVKELEAKGISVDFKDYIPPEIPNDENLAKIPMFTALEYEREPVVKKRYPWDAGGIKWRDETFGVLPSLSIYHKASKHIAISRPVDKASGNWIHGTTMDFPIWQIYYRGTNSTEINFNQPSYKSLLTDSDMMDAWNKTTTPFPFPKKPDRPAKDVEYALKKFDPIWLELIHASNQRPGFRFPLEYEEFYGCLLPHLSYIKGIHQYGKLRASAELHAGHHQEGTDSICLMFQLVDKLDSEAFLISYLVRIADMQITIHPLWEGITHHLFQESDLTKISSHLADMTFIPQIKRALGMERAVHIGEIERVTKYRSYFDRIASSTTYDNQNWPWPWTYQTYIHFAPKGWITQNVRTYSRELTYLEDVLDSWSAGNSNAFSQFKQNFETSIAKPISVYNALSRSWEFGHVNVLTKALRAEATVNIAKTAVALERHYLSKSTYPESLSELVPQFLPEVPLDPINLKPLRYQRLPSKQFKLYSIGANETDDGGEIHKESDKGDWVWRWPLE